MSKHTHRKQGPAGPRRSLHRRTLLAAGVAGVLGGGYFLLSGGTGRAGLSFSVKGGERAPVLDPLQFPERNARLAYMAAARHPETLDQVYCYCYCERPPTLHKSLLSCFTDFHGAG
jgi:hypothetical protein